MIRMSMHRSKVLFKHIPIKLLQTYKRRFPILSMVSFSPLIMPHHHMHSVISLLQDDTMPRIAVLSLSNLPVIPTRSKSMLPTLHYYFLHLLLKILPDTPDTHVHNLFIRIQVHLNVIVAKLEPVCILLNRGESFDQSNFPKEAIAVRLGNEYLPFQFVIALYPLTYVPQFYYLLYYYFIYLALFVNF
jgi:hypothetical protein